MDLATLRVVSRLEVAPEITILRTEEGGPRASRIGPRSLTRNRMPMRAGRRAMPPSAIGSLMDPRPRFRT
eukprot:11699929-Alexandrium_andersonii.AAC.1